MRTYSEVIMMLMMVLIVQTLVLGAALGLSCACIALLRTHDRAVASKHVPAWLKRWVGVPEAQP